MSIYLIAGLAFVVVQSLYSLRYQVVRVHVIIGSHLLLNLDVQLASDQFELKHGQKIKFLKYS